MTTNPLPKSAHPVRVSASARILGFNRGGPAQGTPERKVGDAVRHAVLQMKEHREKARKPILRHLDQ